MWRQQSLVCAPWRHGWSSRFEQRPEVNFNFIGQCFHKLDRFKNPNTKYVSLQKRSSFLEQYAKTRDLAWPDQKWTFSNLSFLAGDCFVADCRRPLSFEQVPPEISSIKLNYHLQFTITITHFQFVQCRKVKGGMVYNQTQLKRSRLKCNFWSQMSNLVLKSTRL